MRRLTSPSERDEAARTPTGVPPCSVDEQAEAWVQRPAPARDAEVGPRGERDLSPAEYERRPRATVAMVRRPTDPYRGPVQAQAQAGAAGDALCAHRADTGHRADWRADRVHVELGPGDVVQAAWRDRAPWVRDP